MSSHSAAPRIHLFNGFHSPYGGSELETLGLFRDLSYLSSTYLWSTSSRSDKQLIERYGIRRARPCPGFLPDGGNYIFAGAHWRRKLWPWLATPPQRLIYIYNTFHPKLLKLTASVPPRWPQPEYVAISDFQCRYLGIEAQVHPSPIDIVRFCPRLERRAGPVRIGRLSRDTLDKHDSEDLDVYRHMASRSVEWRIQGGTCLAPRLSDDRIHLLSPGEWDAADFLRDLDIFYYRTGKHLETFGRVVFEAMACGLPVVCHRRGGYVDWIKHDHNGLLFDTTDEAVRLLAELSDDPERRERLGRAARETVETLYSAQSISERLQFYIR